MAENSGVQSSIKKRKKHVLQSGYFTTGKQIAPYSIKFVPNLIKKFAAKHEKRFKKRGYNVGNIRDAAKYVYNEASTIFSQLPTKWAESVALDLAGRYRGLRSKDGIGHEKLATRIKSMFKNERRKSKDHNDSDNESDEESDDE